MIAKRSTRDGDSPDRGRSLSIADRRAGGELLARALASERGADTVVVGLARGGVETAAAVARMLRAPLDAIAVRKIGHPSQPEYGLGAVVAGDGVYLRTSAGLPQRALQTLVERARSDAVSLDRRLHGRHPALAISGQSVLLVDDGLATGATMVAALRWARAGGSSRVVAAAPVGAVASLRTLRGEADAIVCPHPLEHFTAVGAYYVGFSPVDDDAVIALIDENRRAWQTRPGA